MAELLDEAIQAAAPIRPFMVVDGKPLTYGRFIDRMGRINALLASKDIAQGARVAIVSEDPAMVAALLLACLRAGIAVVNLNPDMTPPERMNALVACDPAHLFIDRAIFEAGPLPAGLAHAVIEADTGPSGLIGKLLKRGAPGTGQGGLRAEIEATAPAPFPQAIAPGTIGLMLFTSGTTSAPKIVQLSHANLAAQLSTFGKVYDYDADSRILNPLPMHFTDGILHGPLVAFVTGATLYRPRRFNVHELGALLDGVYRDRITHFNLVPAMLSLMDRLGEEYRSVFATDEFRYIRSSGDRLPEALWRAVQDRYGVRVINTYGLSETVCEAIYCGPSEQTFRIGTIGKPVDCEIRLVDGEGNDVPEGVAGELVIRGGNIMVGYLGRPDLTEAAIDADGWFRTGDLATIDAEGFVTITGRKKALIISGGVNIQPQEIVDALMTHPAVAEAHVFGLPDPVWGERVVAAVVARPGAAQPDEAALTEHLRALVSANKVPRAIRVLEALPRNPAGKVLVEALRQMFAGAGDGSGAALTGSLEEQIRQIAAHVFTCSPDELRLSSQPRSTFGWDSFAHLTLIGEIERQYGITLSARDVLRVTTLGHLVEIVGEKLPRTGT
ncbi:MULTISPECIES: AMP-binding protein [unclassified Roseitalea]|uniref:AMP-binding protein n=1 Tax=unclassified Roseitalea TaxID=2639107 RepID=UPI00273EB038|nr:MULTISPECIES: AMP-binding protein [unclassified Roseitalea]